MAGSPSPKRAKRLQPASGGILEVEAAVRRPGQVFLKLLQIEGFKTFRDSQSIDMCPGWRSIDVPGHPMPWNGVVAPAPSPLTIVFGGNGAGKSSVFDAVFFVLGQSSKSIRSSGGSSQLVNDQSVLQKGPNASASVTITFQKVREYRDMETESDDELTVDGATASHSGTLQELSVGRSVKHGRGTSTYSLQGKVCSRAAMMQVLNAFVGADMGDVDRYVLKQGSTMVCRREGKELLSFIERLAGTAKLKAETEEVQIALDDLREQALGLEADVQTSLRTRKQLQPQVTAFLKHQEDAAELQHEKTGLWHRKLALLRVRLHAMEAMAAKNEDEATELGEKIKSSEAHYERAERDLARRTRAMENALKSQSSARGKVQKAKSAQAETEAFAKKTLKSARAKGKALTRARKLLEEGDEEIVKLSAHASELDSASCSMMARIDELETSPEFSMPDGEGSAKRKELLRELGALEDGPLPELESSIAERKRLSAKAGQVLDELLSDLGVKRLEMERRDGAATLSDIELKALQERIVKMGAESAKLRAHCATQQALVGSLEARRKSQISNGTHPPIQSNALLPRGIACGWQSPSGARGRSSYGQGRVGALRSLMEKLREGGVGAHGMVADLILLRRQGDEAAVTAVLGSTLRNTIVVQTRKDGARVVAEVKAAGILGQVRCDVLDEIKSKPSARAGSADGVGGGLSLLSGRVTTSDPKHFPAVEKHLRGWLLAETRQVAWDTRSGRSKSSAANVVTASGELFYASGEVAVKAPQASTSSCAPRLGVVQGGQPRGGFQGLARQHVGTHQQVGPQESRHDVELRLKGALESLSAAETSIAELAREEAQARFDCEDGQVRHTMVQTKTEECRREVLRMEHKVSAQRRLVPGGDGSGDKDSAEDDADETQLEMLRQRRDEIVAELAEYGESEPGSQGMTRQIDASARSAAIQELRNLRAKVDNHRELRDEVEVKLHVFTKRGKTRRDRVETLKAEKKDCENLHKSTKARQLLHEEKSLTLLSAFEEAKSIYRVEREVAREAEGAARKAKRELSAIRAIGVELSHRQNILTADRRKTEANSSRMMQRLANAVRTAAEAEGPSSGDGPAQEPGDEYADKSDTVAADAAAAAASLARELDRFTHLQSSNKASDVNGGLESSNGGGDNNGRCRREAYDEERARGMERDFEFDCPLTSDRRDAAAAPSACGAEDETKVAAFVRLLEENGGETEFFKETGITEASIRLKEVNVKKRREALDIAAITRAARLDRDSVDLERKLEAAQESVVSLMEKKEVLEATRHATLVKCLQEVNGALGGIYRRLTSVEDPGKSSSNPTEHGKSIGKSGVRSVPGGDCFLRFSLERTLLLSEGLAVQVKPEPASPWRSPGSLSGGQVALVGLALNLATQAVRPAPLYLMDEIDAALDTHKVRRVAAMLADRARSGNEQCIVISHRPEMQERASHLVGVYHCEGTARTVSLELLPQLPPGREEDGCNQSDLP